MKRLSVVLFFALGIAVAWHFRGSPAFPQTVRLADGSKVTITGVTYGTNHVSPGVLPERIVKRLPKWIVKRFGITPRQTFRSKEPEFHIWFELWGEGSPSKQRDLRAVFADDAGLESSGGPLIYITPWGDYSSSSEIARFPRRSPTIRLRLYDREDDGRPILVASFQFANPAFGHFPEWRAGSPTAKSPSGDFEATIRSVVVGRDSDMGERLLPLNDYNGTLTGEARFQVRFGGRTATNWQVEYLELTDATGNRTYPIQPVTSVEGDELKVRFGPALWPDGSAWKMRARFIRLPSADFAPEELVTFRNVPLPTNRIAAFLGWKTNIQGRTLMLKGLVLAGGRLANSSFQRIDSPKDQIVAEVVPSIPWSWTNGVTASIVSVKSSLGDELKTNPRGQWPWATVFPTNAATVDITFAVQHSRVVEFMVKPELITRSQAGLTPKK